MISNISILIILLAPFCQGCPESPVPPCTCTFIGNVSSFISCNKVDNEDDLFLSMQSMASSTVPISTVEILGSVVNFLPSHLFEGMAFEKLLIAGSLMVSLSDTDVAFVGLENSLKTLLVQDSIFFSGWKWSHLRNLVSLRELSTVKARHVNIDSDIKEIAHLDIRDLFLIQDTIASIHETAFATFSNLKTLSLEKNLIKHLKRSMFPNPATKFEQIILSHNQIEFLPPDLFSSMPNLKSVILAHNNVFTVSKETFLPVWNHLSKVDLSGNHLRCDCSLKWLLETTFPRDTWAQCTEPSRLEDKKLQDLQDNDLGC